MINDEYIRYYENEQLCSIKSYNKFGILIEHSIYENGTKIEDLKI